MPVLKKKKKSEFSRLHSLEIVVHTIRAKYMHVEKKIFRLDSDVSGTSFCTWRKTVIELVVGHFWGGMWNLRDGLTF